MITVWTQKKTYEKEIKSGHFSLLWFHQISLAQSASNGEIIELVVVLIQLTNRRFTVHEALEVAASMN